MLLAALPQSPSLRGPVRGMKRVYSVTQHFYCLAGTMSDTGAYDPSRGALTGTDCCSIGAVQADSQVLVCESPVARHCWHPYNVPMLRLPSPPRPFLPHLSGTCMSLRAQGLREPASAVLLCHRTLRGRSTRRLPVLYQVGHST